jgi:hypothetical protein
LGKEGLPKHEITPVNNVAFVLYIWKKGRYSLKNNHYLQGLLAGMVTLYIVNDYEY